MKTRLLLLLIAFFLAPFAAQAQRMDPLAVGTSPRRTWLLDQGWKFNRGDIVLPPARGHHEIYTLVKAGAARGAAAFNYDDANWTRVDLPHDYVVDGPFLENESVSHGFQPRPVAWYRRQFSLDPKDNGKCIWLYFDGVMGRTQVWVNGQELTQSNNGYIGFRVNLSDVAHFGDRPNTIAVRTDPSEPQGWFYEGGGIYRHVWLTVAEPLHVAPHGVFVSPEKREGTKWDTQVLTTIENEGPARTIRVVTTLEDESGKVVGRAEKTAEVPALEKLDIRQSIPVDNPALWNIDNPRRHRARTEIFEGATKLDAVVTWFGYRTLRFDAAKGLFINDRYTKLKGVCMHQDHAGVGSAVPDAIQEFRVARMKQMGVNAYRCSHNPPATEILEACDRLGMVVMNENRFYNSGEAFLGHVEEQTLRDRNHPSVIMWSLFNEEPWQGDERGRRMVERMARVIKRHDTTRPITGAMNGGFNKQGAFGAVDILGINYFLGQHDQAHKLVPDKFLFGSENVSHNATRGEWTTDGRRRTFENYDSKWVSWGSSVREAWKLVDTREWDGGMFIWTGFDYRGEPTPHAWPVISSYFGIVDTCGFAKDSFYLCQALWTDKPMVHVFPHWNLGDGMVGKKVKVGTYTNAEEVELVLNGKSLGRRTVNRYEQLFWDVEYAPGKLEAKAFAKGRQVAADFVETTGEPVALGLEVQFDDWKRTQAFAGVADALPVVAYAVDAKGRRVPTASSKVTFAVDNGRVLGVGNGDPTCHEPDRARSRSLFNGYACAIVEAGPVAGKLRIVATAPDLKPARLELPIVAAKGMPQYPALQGEIVLSDWRLSSVTPTAQDPNRVIADNDMNTWEPITITSGPQQSFASAKGFATFRTTFAMPQDGKPQDLVFGGIVGAAEVYVNGTRVGSKTQAAKGSLTVPVDAPAGSKVTVSVQLQVSDASCGIVSGVRLVPAKAARRPGKAPARLSASTSAGEIGLKPGNEWQVQKLAAPAKGRFVTIEALAMHGGDGFAHAAEFDLVDASGKALPKSGWRIHYVGSEETDKEDSRAENLIDGKADTFWHSRWSTNAGKPPHIIVIDLGRETTFSGIRYLGRPADKIGGIARLRLHVTPAAP